MKLWRIVIVLLIFFGSCKKTAEVVPEPAQKEKDIEFVEMSGDTILLSSFKGKRLLVNYWATWCIPCRAEFPSLIKAEEELKGENYVFLFPTTDEMDLILEFKAKQGYDLRFLKMNSSLARVNVHVLPTTAIYGTDGKMFKQIQGALEWDEEEIIKMLKKVP